MPDRAQCVFRSVTLLAACVITLSAGTAVSAGQTKPSADAQSSSSKPLVVCAVPDSMPRTGEFAANRLARMIGLDRRTVTTGDAEDLASRIVSAAKQRIRDSLAILAPSCLIVVSGHGQEMVVSPPACLASDNTILRLSDQVGLHVARCAPSYAVARLLDAETMGAFQ